MQNTMSMILYLTNNRIYFTFIGEKQLDFITFCTFAVK